MESISLLLNYLLHIDTFLIAFVSQYGIWTYVILFAIIFCETGLVIMPFLPGDSLLFAAGSLAANATHALNIQVLLLLLIIASILGNKLNYLIGRAIGPRLFSMMDAPRTETRRHKAMRFLLNKKHLEESHQFYEKHGGKTIILARFIPIIRSFAPFVAGIGYMGLGQFSFYNITSAVLWIGSLLGAGYFFGTLPIIKENFSIVIYGIIILSLLPPTIAFLYKKVGSVS